MSIHFRHNVSLLQYNTFGIDVKARRLAEIQDPEELKELHASGQLDKEPLLILGGGSNVLFTRDYEGLVLLNRMKGIEKVQETEDHVYLRAASGEVWHELVLYSIAQGLGGLENMSLIPGTVGAAPIQNIGAYGAELKDVFYCLEAFHLPTGEMHHLTAEACRFGYRDSIFKRESKGQYFICSVTVKLSKVPILNISYGAIKDTLAHMGKDAAPTPASVSEAVISIRRSKLPDPAVIGNAGSFFKNPEISRIQYDELKAQYPAMPGYVIDEATVKVPAGWLIEQCGWKGKQVGQTGSHKDQALVLVNYGGATGDEVKNLSAEICRSVLEKFGVVIVPEVNVV